MHPVVILSWIFPFHQLETSLAGFALGFGAGMLTGWLRLKAHEKA